MVFNLVAWLHEIETGEVYEMSAAHEIYSGLGEFDRQADKTIDAAEREHIEREEAAAAAAATVASDATDADAAGDSKMEDSKDSKSEEAAAASDGSAAEPAATATGGADGSAGAGAEATSAATSTPKSETKQQAAKRARAEERRREQALRRARCIVDAFDGVKVFLVGGTFDDILTKRRYKNLFHHVNLSAFGVHHLQDERFASILRDEAVISAELARNMVALRDYQSEAFEEKVTGFVRERGGIKVGTNLNLTADNFSEGSHVASKGVKTPDPVPEVGVFLWQRAEAEKRAAAYKAEVAANEAKAAAEAAAKESKESA